MPRFVDVTDTSIARTVLGVEGSVSVTQYGAVGDGVTDDTAALQAAFDAAENGGVVVLPAGKTFAYPSQLTVPVGAVVQGPGRFWSTSASLVATHASAFIELNRFAHLRDVTIDGGGVAEWGVMCTNSLKPAMSNVIAREFSEAGFIFDATQNSLISDCISHDCKVGFMFLNGAANIDLVGCEDSNYGDVYGADHRSILFDNSTDSRTQGSVLYSGNRAIRFGAGFLSTAPQSTLLTFRTVVPLEG